MKLRQKTDQHIFVSKWMEKKLEKKAIEKIDLMR